jgi:isopentenyldiphosphate isomerase
MARWLCHLLGLRHKVVQLFIDHPAEDSLTLVQVRGVNKAEAPGCFDAPAAGHVVGLESETGAISLELEQELGLAVADLDESEMIGTYHYCAPLDHSTLCNVEFCVVFAGRLKPGRLQRIRFVDGEVAAISLFALSELQALIDTFPERVAPGLLGAFPTYLRSRGERQVN